MPYNSLQDLPADVKKLPEGGQKIFLAAFNSAYSGNSCKNKGDTDRESCAFAIAWAAVKRKYQKQGEEWVEKAASASTAHSPIAFFAGAAEGGKYTISGPLINIGELNLNGWGVPENEVAAVITSLKGVPLRICSGPAAVLNEHSCDYKWDPRSDIGNVIDAFEQAGWVHAKAEVTDAEAVQKLSDGTWPKTWSIFLSHKSAQGDGMLTDITAHSVTLVRNPAYPGAGFNAAAGGTMDYTKDQILSVLQYLKTNSGVADQDIKNALFQCPEKISDKDHARFMLKILKDNPGMLDDDMRGMMQAMTSVNSGAANGNHSKDKKEVNMGEEANGDKKTYTQEEVDKMVATALERERTTFKTEMDRMVTKDTAEKLVQAGIEKAKADTLEQIRKEQLAGEIADLQVSAGLIKPEEKPALQKDLITKSAAVLESEKAFNLRIKEKLEGAAAAGTGDKFKNTQLPGSAATPSLLGMKSALDKINSKFMGAPGAGTAGKGAV